MIWLTIQMYTICSLIIFLKINFNEPPNTKLTVFTFVTDVETTDFLTTCMNQ